MELFNKYKNKNFTYFTNYINSCINDESLALTEEELKTQLSGTSQSTFEEFILALTNACHDGESYNANILYKKNDTMLPIRQIPIPIRASLAEKAWLFYVLHNSKSDLFLDHSTKSKLLSALESELDAYKFPLKSEYIDLRLLSPDNKLTITQDFLKNFKAIVYAIKQHRKLLVTNITFDGHIYKNQEVLPYKLEYSVQFDSFSLSCCLSSGIKRPLKMNLINLSDITVGNEIENYDLFLKEFKLQLKHTKEKVPITIEIRNQAEAYDRCAYLFSSFDTFCYDKGKDILIMNIYYYRFQKDEVIRNILLLGHYVKVISPQFIVNEVISQISEAYKAYC